MYEGRFDHRHSLVISAVLRASGPEFDSHAWQFKFSIAFLTQKKSPLKVLFFCDFSFRKPAF